MSIKGSGIGTTSHFLKLKWETSKTMEPWFQNSEDTPPQPEVYTSPIMK